jgi:hypothetical protein
VVGEKFEWEGALSRAGSPLEPKLREVVSLGVSHAWARAESRRGSELVVSR